MLSSSPRLEAPELRDGLKANRFLRQLNLFGNHLTDWATQPLADALAENQTLQVLGLGNNRITHVGVQTLCK